MFEGIAQLKLKFWESPFGQEMAKHGWAYRIAMAVLIAVVLVVIQPLVKAAPYAHAAIVIYIRMYVIGRIL